MQFQDKDTFNLPNDETLILVVGENTFLSYKDAHDYFSESTLSYLNWQHFNSPKQAVALASATKLISRESYLGTVENPTGDPVRDLQARTWPSDLPTGGTSTPHGTIPTIVREATAELALVLLERGGELAHDEPAVTRRKVGDLDIEYKPSRPDPKGSDHLPTKVRDLLKPLLRRENDPRPASIALKP